MSTSLWKTEATQALPGLRLSSNSGHGDSGTENCQEARRDTHFSTPLFRGTDGTCEFKHDMRRFFKAPSEDSRAFSSSRLRLRPGIPQLRSGRGASSHDWLPNRAISMAPSGFRASGHHGRAAERPVHGQHRAICRFPATPLRGGGVRAATCGSNWRGYRPSGLRPPLHAMGHLDGESHHHRRHGRSRGASANDAASSVGLILAATFLAAIVDFALDLILNTLTLVIRGTGSVRDLARNLGPVALAGIPLYTSLVGLLAYSYIEVSPWSAALFFIPALRGSEALRDVSGAARNPPGSRGGK